MPKPLSPHFLASVFVALTLPFRTDTPKGARVFIEKVSPPETDCDYPCWSPDGKWIAFDGSKGGEGYELSNLMVVRADGSDFRQLTNALFDMHYPSWR